MPTYMHPEAQIKTPDCPLPKTEHRGTSSTFNKKSKYERMAMQQVRDDPFQLKSHINPNADPVQLEIQEANLARQRLLERLTISD